MIFKKVSKTKSLVSLLVIIAMFFCILQSKGQSEKDKNETVFADQWEFIGTAVKEPDYTIWGTSPVWGVDGKVHLFVARWPCELKVDPGWRTHSEIAHNVGNTPEGPFRFVQLVGKAKGEG